MRESDSSAGKLPLESLLRGIKGLTGRFKAKYLKIGVVILLRNLEDGTKELAIADGGVQNLSGISGLFLIPGTIYLLSHKIRKSLRRVMRTCRFTTRRHGGFRG